MKSSPQGKPSIVFLPRTLGRRLLLQHVIPTLQAEECPVMAVQCGLDTPEGDVATVKTGEEKS
jgi:hypothetical protein